MSGGTRYIDGMFPAMSLELIKDLYLGVGGFYSHNNLLWVEISLENAFIHLLPRIITPNNRHIQVNYPHLVDEFNHLYA